MHEMAHDTPDSRRGSGAAPPVAPGVPPFDTARLDAAMEEAGLDALVVTSKHNVQYLLGGYTFFFFEARDPIGLSRYLPVLAYVRSRPDLAAYIGNRLEVHEKQNGRFWTPVAETVSWGTVDAVQRAAAHLERCGVALRRIGVEPAFLPADAAEALRGALGNREMVDSYYMLERLRAVKTPAEVTMLREASERVVDSMLATLAAIAPGMTKAEVAERLRQEEVRRGLTFEYCLITAGTNLNRAPSGQRLEGGDILSLDSGGNYHGYIGDLCRMGILGESDAELEELLGTVEAVQQAARRVVRAGQRGGEVQAAGEAAVAASPLREHMEFLSHGMGLVQHEAPWLTSHGVVPYPGHDEHRPLEAGMVVSVETTLKHPRRGFIKLEDTLLVTEAGSEGLGDAGRGWNRAGRG